MAKAEHLGGDRYRVRLYDVSIGRQRTRTFRAQSQRAANRQASKQAAKLQDAIDGHKAEQGSVTELARAWLRHRESRDSPTTLRRTRPITERIIADLGGIRLEDLSARHVDEWLDSLRAERLRGDTQRSESTIHHYWRVLRAMIHQGERWDMIDHVIVPKVTKLKVRTPKVTPPTPDVLGVVLASCSPHLRFAASLAAKTGLRRGELVGLRWSDIVGGETPMLLVRAEDGNVVELEGGRLERKATKTEQDREVWLDPVTWLAMMRHRHALTEAAAFFGGELADDAAVLADVAKDPTGRTPRRPGWLTLAWRRACEAQGAKIRLHDLRHFQATLQLEQGLSLAEVADRIGHSQVSTTANVYAHGTKSGRARAAEIAGELPF